jgi:hypothetical protein
MNRMETDIRKDQEEANTLTVEGNKEGKKEGFLTRHSPRAERQIQRLERGVLDYKRKSAEEQRKRKTTLGASASAPTTRFYHSCPNCCL